MGQKSGHCCNIFVTYKLQTFDTILIYWQLFEDVR